MPSITLTWKAILDERTCPICRALHGYTWVFVTGKDKMDYSLIHPQFGVVWDVARGSQAHGHERFNCRCHLDCHIELGDMLEKVKELYEQVKKTAEATPS